MSAFGGKADIVPCSVRDVGVAGSNPATPTIRFTKQFKRLVNFLNLRKNLTILSPVARL